MAHGVTRSTKDGRFEQNSEDFLRLSLAIQRCQEMIVVDIRGGIVELAAYLASRSASHVWCIEPDPNLAVQARDTLAGSPMRRPFTLRVRSQRHHRARRSSASA